VFGLALLQSKVQVNDSWLDYFIIGVYLTGPHSSYQSRWESWHTL
jgi:hypothetical protein